MLMARGTHSTVIVAERQSITIVGGCQYTIHAQDQAASLYCAWYLDAAGDIRDVNDSAAGDGGHRRQPMENTGKSDERRQNADLVRAFRSSPAEFVRRVEQACPAGVSQGEHLLDTAVDLAEQGDFKPALALLERAAELYEKAHDNAGLARAYVNIGPLYGMLGELERGVSYSLKAEALAATLQPEPELTLHFASDLGGMYTELEEWERAMHYFGLARVTAQAVGNRELEADALLVMSQVAIAQGDAGMARTLAGQGKALGEELDDTLFRARALQTMGDADALEGNYEQAVQVFLQALELEALMPDVELRQQLLWELSEAYEEQGKAELAEKTRSQAAELGGGEDEESEEADE